MKFPLDDLSRDQASSFFISVSSHLGPKLHHFISSTKGVVMSSQALDSVISPMWLLYAPEPVTQHLQMKTTLVSQCESDDERTSTGARINLARNYSTLSIAQKTPYGPSIRTSAVSVLVSLSRIARPPRINDGPPLYIFAGGPRDQVAHILREFPDWRFDYSRNNNEVNSRFVSTSFDALPCLVASDRGPDVDQCNMASLIMHASVGDHIS